MDYEEVSHSECTRRLGRLPSGTDVAVTVHRYDGGAGPTVYVQAAQHGIELNGPAALRRFHSRLVDAELAGTVIVVPLVNPLAFDHRSYITPAEYDAVNPNLNRVWPGDESGSLQERLAANLWELVTGADAVVDLHTGSADMLEHVRFRAGRTAARRLSEAFGTEYTLTDCPEADDETATKTFRAAATRVGIPAITAELGNSRTVAPEAVTNGVDGLFDVLRAVDALQAPLTQSPDQTRLSDAPEMTVAAASGLFEPHPGIQVGDHIEANEELGAVYDPSTFERQQTVTAADTGVAYSVTRESVVVAGERLLDVARPV